MRDLTSPKAMVFKAALFLVLATLCGIGLWLRARQVSGQLELEARHLRAKLASRRPHLAHRLAARHPMPHPLFHVVPGAIEPWERPAGSAR